AMLEAPRRRDEGAETVPTPVAQPRRRCRNGADRVGRGRGAPRTLSTPLARRRGGTGNRFCTSPAPARPPWHALYPDLAPTSAPLARLRPPRRRRLAPSPLGEGLPSRAASPVTTRRFSAAGAARSPAAPGSASP